VDVVLVQVTAKLSADTASSGEADSSSQWVARFAQATLEEHRVRASTLEAYTLDVAMLSGWAAKQKRNLLGLTGGDLARYLRERLEQGTHASTASRQLSSWKRFYSFLVDQGALAASPAAAVRAPRVTRHEPRQVPDDLLSKLLRPASGRDASAGSAYRARRDHAIVWTLYATGLGVSDVRLLRWPQIDEELHVIEVPDRNGPARSLVLDTQSLAVFKALRESAGAAGPEQGASYYCFPTASGLPMSRQALCHVVRKWAGDCGSAEVVTPSMLRQTGRAHHAQRSRR
jgi:site-specific recombinase XerD